MSAARVHFKEDKQAPKKGDHKAKKSGHPFRTALWISIVLAGIILWQLNPIIHGLHTTASTLTRAEPIRRVVSGLISLVYHRIATTVAPLIHRVTG